MTKSNIYLNRVQVADWFALGRKNVMWPRKLRVRLYARGGKTHLTHAIGAADATYLCRSSIR
jgi:hypothetical protein